MPRPEINWAKRRLWTANAIIAERAALNGEPPPMPRHLNWREWLEELQTYNSPDGDRARQILRLFDDLEAIGETYEQLFGVLENSGHADVNDDGFDMVARVRQIAQRDEALHALAERAGLLNKDDTTTDPLPLLAMFLPVD